MSRKTLLILAASRYQVPAIERALALGYRVLTADNVPSNPGHALADQCFDVDTTDQEGILALARRQRIHGILAMGTDVAVPSAARVSEELGLPGPPRRCVDITCDKIAFRRFLNEQGLPVPESIALSDAEPLPVRCFERGRWVLKPDRSSGSKGVFVAASAAEAEAYLPVTRSFSPTGRIILERYLEGAQGSCEGIVRAGHLAHCWLTDRLTPGLPHVATRGHLVPASFGPEIERRLREQLLRVWAALGLRDAVFDCDFVVSGREVHLLEVSPRLGGNCLPLLIQFATGFAFVDYAIQLACGDVPCLPDRLPARPGAVLILGTEGDGLLDYHAGEVAKLKAEPWVTRLELDLPAGAPVRRFVNGRCRVGEAFLAAPDRPTLEARIAEFHQRLRLEARPVNTLLPAKAVA